MQYISTRGQAPVLNFEEAMLTGLARDGGLYVPAPLIATDIKLDVSGPVVRATITQRFENPSDSWVEATYVFPVPKGASVREFSMWVDGQRVKGELLKAERAKKMYTDIVRQTKEPALLEYIGTDVLTLKIYPVPAKGDQKVEVSFTAIAKKENFIEPPT